MSDPGNKEIWKVFVVYRKDDPGFVLGLFPSETTAKQFMDRCLAYPDMVSISKRKIALRWSKGSLVNTFPASGK